MKKILPFISLIIILSACESTDIEPIDPADIPLVVEGWIEEGQNPVVMVTHAADLTVDEPSFDNFVEKWCRVSIYDDDRQYVLTGRLNNNYTPPLIFTSTRLKGRAGHTYRLTVETEDRVLTSSVTMTAPPHLDSLRAERVPGNDSLYSIRAFVTPGECKYMKFFVKALPDESRYYPSFLGTIATEEYDPTEGIVITRSKRSEFNDSVAESFTHYFEPGQTVLVHACSVQPEVFRFWQVYDATVSLSENLFFSFNSNLPGNIDGGLGYFAGYGSSERAIRIPQATE